MSSTAPLAPPKAFTIAVAGNPNSGKTTLFNGLTGASQRVGNWPGVTVERKEGTAKIGDDRARVVDLPGIYSLSAHTEDERIARDYLLSGDADLIINIVDSTNLERNLYLSTALLEMGLPMLIVLNMADRAEAAGMTVDTDSLAKATGCPVISVSAVKRLDIEQVRQAAQKISKGSPAVDSPIRYPSAIEEAAAQLSPRLASAAAEIGTDPRRLAMRALEGDSWAAERAQAAGVHQQELDSAIGDLEERLGDAPDVAMAEARYALIGDWVKAALTRPKPRVTATERADRIVMNRILGIPIFLGVMYLVFWVTINVGGAFIDFFDILFGTVFVDGLGALMGAIRAPGWLTAIIAGGVGAGVQTVATFVPIIFTMFLMLSLLEDSGYMARAAFVMDRFMQAIGLPGKSFIPMIVGFGCTIPAVMATRTLDQKRDRFMTVFMVPFMSCGARLPVYALFGAAFFGARAGLVVFSLYAVGIVLAILTGLLLKNTMFKGQAAPSIMELPDYHAPRFRHIMRYTWNRLRVFIRRAGLVIVIVVAVLSFFNSLGTDGSFGNEDAPESVLALVGRAITPIFTPMGIERDNWPASVAIFTGIFAKEAVVGTLNGLYSQIDTAAASPDEEAEEEAFRLWPGIRESLESVPAGLGGIFASMADPMGVGVISEDQAAVAEELETDDRVFSAMRGYFGGGAGAYAYLLFILIYFPCIAALGAILREIGTGYGWLSMAYLTVLAWLTATLYYQIAAGHQVVWIIVPIVLLAGIVVLFGALGRASRRANVMTT